ncbi:glycosyltransferase [Tessaracoccus palaemonis]|uniref:Glycosyltransferase n=1 Tax=Tessaracoccus palaemonis TaxID=2829499 RepID=A0ABX8SJQ1_9ACTN|nr:glycosyltransferase [Tessaracoccus palaemonis]QXT63109.1 glycosyltransferase [Tessaracoccus palaemonis]
MPLLSVIVTSYNIQDYLRAALDSILAQTLRDIEVIVVDDGSTDASPDIIRDYAARDPRIVPVIRGVRSPGGVATAANAGLDVATGTYVGFADGDDLYDPTMFEKLVGAAVENNSDLVMCNYRLFSDASGDASWPVDGVGSAGSVGALKLDAPADEHRWVELARDSYELDDDLRHTLLRFVAVPWRKLYRRQLLEEHAIRFPVGDYFFEDNPFHWFALLHADSISLVREVLCLHRVARAGQTMATADERLLRIFQHHATIHAFLEETDRRDEFAPTLLGWAISQLEWISRKAPRKLHRELYDAVVEVFDRYSEAEVLQALAEGRKGRRTRNLSIALARRNYARFAEVLRTEEDRRYALPIRLLNHLRYSGVRQTATMSVRYARQRFRVSGQLSAAVNRLTPRRESVTNEHLLFALASLEDRLDRIESQLDSPDVAERSPVA